MRAHSWRRTLQVGLRAEAVLDAVFGPEFVIVRGTPAHQQQKIDRFWIHRRDGRLIHKVDYKCDETAGRTRNLALEHVSVVRKGQREAPGWLHVTIADLIVTYVPALDTAFVLEVQRLRDAWPDIMTCFPPKRAATSDHGGYQSLICCVPIAWLKRAGLIARTVEAVGRQMRFQWPGETA